MLFSSLLVETLQTLPDPFPFPFHADQYRYSNNSKELDPPSIVTITKEYKDEILLKRELLKNNHDHCYQAFPVTHLFLIGPKEVVNDWEKTGTKVGFPVDAIHKFVLENNFKQVFCAKCYHKHKQRLNECNHCPNCLTQLSISDHFSKQHSAYLGYINLEE